MTPQALAPVIARDGERLAFYQWETQAWDPETGHDALPPHALILIVHGLGEHARRYGPLAALLLNWGFAVCAYDQRGHGDSGGARGVLPHDTVLLEDLADVMDTLRPPGQAAHAEHAEHSKYSDHASFSGSTDPLPLILLGHSLGGLVASRFVALKMRPVQGLVLSSPALTMRLSTLQKCLLAVMHRLAPDWPVGNGLDTRYLSHDEHVVRNYQLDPRVHDRISARLARFMASAGPDTQAAASNWQMPTLLLYAGADRLVDPDGSRVFAQNAAEAVERSAMRAGVVTARCFDGLYHELFNERDSAPVFIALKTWLDARF